MELVVGCDASVDTRSKTMAVGFGMVAESKGERLTASFSDLGENRFYEVRGLIRTLHWLKTITVDPETVNLVLVIDSDEIIRFVNGQDGNYIRRLLDEYKSHRFEVVKSHTGSLSRYSLINNECDRLAKDAMRVLRDREIKARNNGYNLSK